MKILENLREQNVLFITTDVHFAEVFKYTPFQRVGDNFSFHEVVVGPGNAGIFPNPNFDKSFASERLFFYGPDSYADVKTWEQAKQWFNYGVIVIDDSGELTIHIKNTYGENKYSLNIPALY